YEKLGQDNLCDVMQHFYTSGQSNFSLFHPLRGDKRIENRVVAFNKSEICEICKLEDTRNIGP
ncbi:Hypothetical predicted protein, partial [Mytilus galloprovincialis]